MSFSKMVDLLREKEYGKVVFASYALKENSSEGKDISTTVKRTFGINMPELDDKRNLKRLAGIGLATSAVIVLF